MRSKPLSGHPSDVWHFHSIRGLHRTSQNAPPMSESTLEQPANFGLKSTLPQAAWTENNLPHAIGLDLVWNTAKARVFTDFFPGSHVPMMPLSSVSRNPQISLS
jgi:hypothetical protein